MSNHKAKEKVNDAYRFLDSFLETDMENNHHCAECGHNEKNQVCDNEVLIACKLLREALKLL